jgi:hypothetical protein
MPLLDSTHIRGIAVATLLSRTLGCMNDYPGNSEALANYAVQSKHLPIRLLELDDTPFLVLLHSERFRLAQQLQDIDLARDALAQRSNTSRRMPNYGKSMMSFAASALP